MKLNLIVATILVTMLIGCSGLATIRSDNQLLQTLLLTRNMDSANAQRSMECFYYYGPLLNEATKKYEAEYEYCVQVAEQRTNETDNLAWIRSNGLHTNISATCETLNECMFFSDFLDVFDCYANRGIVSSSFIKDASSSALQYGNELQMDRANIYFEKNACANAAENRYHTNADAIYADLHNCLNGLAPVPTTTTAAPETPPAAPETTTAAPETTTAAPETTTAAP